MRHTIEEYKGTDNEEWVGDTVRLTLTKLSGVTPDLLGAVIITKAKYSD